MHAAYGKSLAHIRWSEHLNLCPRDAKCMYSFCINLLTFTPVLCCCFVVFLWAPWEAYRHTLVISGDQTVLAFKIAFLCNNLENLQGSSSAQACKYYISCWAVRVIHMYVYIYVCVYTCFFFFSSPPLLSDTWVCAEQEMSRTVVLSGWYLGGGPGGSAGWWLCPWGRGEQPGSSEPTEPHMDFLRGTPIQNALYYTVLYIYIYI